MNDKLNVRRAIRMYHDFNEMYGVLLAFMPGKGVQIYHTGMEQVAPLPVWNLNNPKQQDSGETTYHHDIRIDGVLFYTQTDSPIEVNDDTEAPF